MVRELEHSKNNNLELSKLLNDSRRKCITLEGEKNDLRRTIDTDKVKYDSLFESKKTLEMELENISKIK